MKKHPDLNEILKKMEADELNKSEKKVRIGELRIDPFSGKLVHGNDVYELSDWSIKQLCQKMDGIPPNYFKKCPNVLKAQNANHWLQQDQVCDKNVVLKIHQEPNGTQKLRGMVSNIYTSFEDRTVLEIVNQYMENKEYRVDMWNEHDEGFHLRVIMPREYVLGDTLDGRPDVHKVGVHISNSEVGGRSIWIIPVVYRLVCTNGMMAWRKDGEVFRQRHVFSSYEKVYEEVAARIGIAMHAAESQMEMLKTAKMKELKEPLTILERVGKQHKMTKEFLGQVHASYEKEPGNNVFYLVQAITDAAKSLSDEERVEKELIAGKILKEMTA